MCKQTSCWVRTKLPKPQPPQPLPSAPVCFVLQTEATKKLWIPGGENRCFWFFQMQREPDYFCRRLCATKAKMSFTHYCWLERPRPSGDSRLRLVPRTPEKHFLRSPWEIRTRKIGNSHARSATSLNSPHLPGKPLLL